MTLFASPQERGLVDAAVPDGLDVAFGMAPAPVEGRVVRFADHRMRADDLLVGCGREDLWRWAPWPAADELFALPAPEDDAPVLVVHGDAAWRDRLVEGLAANGVEAIGLVELDRDRLEASGTVLHLRHDAFPATAFSVCAAGRLLVLASVVPTFGLQPAVDCLVAAGPDEPISLASAVRWRPRAFDGVRALGRIAAAAHRASDVYERLALDVSLGVGVPAERGERD